LLKEKNPDGYNKSIPQKLLRFLWNYWVVVMVFSVVGMLSGNGATIPGSIEQFAGNFFLYRLSYNGAWWFVVTYLFLSLLSPLFIGVVKRTHPLLLIGISGGLYFASYLFRFNFVLSIPNTVANWIWNQLILLGTSQFGYVFGMTCRKERWISRLRVEISNTPPLKRCVLKLMTILLVLAAFIGHCVVQSLLVAPVTAATVLLCLFFVKLPEWMESGLLFMGKHSTNIWLVHMFFYFTLFDGLVFAAKYPLFIFILMMTICVSVSCVINGLMKAAEYGRKRMKE
jgi:hypothetical protein